jgi:hypothetical protein
LSQKSAYTETDVLNNQSIVIKRTERKIEGPLEQFFILGVERRQGGNWSLAVTRSF